MSISTTVLDLLYKAWPPVVTYLLGIASRPWWHRFWRRIRRKPDIRIHVERDPRIIYANDPDWSTFPQFLAKRREELPFAPTGKATEMPMWAAAHGGFAAYTMDLLVTLTAWEDLDVVVQALRVVATSRSLPDGFVLVRPVGGASMEFRRMEATLSSWATTVLSMERGGTTVERFAFQLDRGKSAQFHLIVQANGEESNVNAYEWTATLDLVVGGQTSFGVHRQRRQAFRHRQSRAMPRVVVDRHQVGRRAVIRITRVCFTAVMSHKKLVILFLGGALSMSHSASAGADPVVTKCSASPSGFGLTEVRVADAPMEGAKVVAWDFKGSIPPGTVVFTITGDHAIRGVKFEGGAPIANYLFDMTTAKQQNIQEKPSLSGGTLREFIAAPYGAKFGSWSADLEVNGVSTGVCKP